MSSQGRQSTPRRTAIYTALCTAALLASCNGAEPKQQELAFKQAALGVSGGGIPIPVDPATGEEKWDDGYAALLHADALAECNLQHLYGGTLNTAADTDASAAWLLSRMGAVIDACPHSGTSGSSVPDNDYLNYLQSRISPQ